MNNQSQYGETILVVEDDSQIASFICYALHSQGYRYIVVPNGASALQSLLSEQIDMMLLDLGLPDIDGTEIIKKVREWSQIPIIVVSARDQDKEKVNALDLGADDYLTKPFSATELMARIRVAARHMYKERTEREQTLFKTGELELDIQKRLVFVCREEKHLTPMEYSLLNLLFHNQGKVLTTAVIIKELWGAGYGSDTQALRALMASLRRKVEKNPAKPRYIKTEIGVGYRLSDESV